MIPTAELDAMQAVLDETMPDTAIIYKPVRTADNSGGFTEALVPGAPVECRIAPLAGGVGGATAEVIMAGRVGTAEAWIVSFPADTDVASTDSFITSGDRAFEVAVVLGPRTWEISRRVVAVEMG